MKENYKDIFKKNFDQLEDDIDPQIIWDNIKPKKKKKNMLWFFLSSFLLILIVSISYLYFQKDANEIASSQTKPSKTVETIDASEKLNENQPIKEIAQDNHVLTADTYSNKVDEKLNQINSSRNAEQTFTEVKKNDLEPKPSISFSSRNSALAAQETEIQKDLVHDFSTKEIKKRVIDENLSFPDSIPVAEKIIVKNLDRLMLNELDFVGRKIPIRAMRFEQYPRSNNRNQFKELNKGFSLAVNSSYGFLNAERSVDPGANQNVYLHRIETVSELEAARINMLVNYHLSNRISFGTGIQYTRINELFEWQGNYKRTTNGEYVTEIIETPEETYFSFAEGEYEENVQRNMKIYNKTNLISIPLIANFHQAFGDFSLSIGAGIEANVFQFRDGYVLNELEIPVALQDQESSKFGLSYFGKIGVEYRLTDQLSFGASFGYIQMRHSEIDLNTSYAVKDLGLGLRYTLGG